jgi:thiol-disulfide isomerase/thioredoxin
MSHGRSFRAGLMFALVPLAAAGLGAIAAQQLLPPAGSDPAERVPVLRFRLASLDGRQLGPGDFAGKVVVLDLWATWCEPCRIQARLLETLSREYSVDQVQFLAVNVEEPEAVVRDYVAERPFSYPVLLDPDNRVGGELGVIGLPTLVVIDRQGRVVSKDLGIQPLERLRSLLEEAGA